MLMPWTHRVALSRREVAMRPARIIAAVTLAAAAVVTGSYLAVSTAHPSAAAPTAPVTAPPLQPTRPVDLPKAPVPIPRGPIIDRIPAPRPVLADGRYDSYIRTVDSRHHRLVVDLVQVFDGQAARDAAIADGMAPDKAQYLGVYVRNQNPQLRTLVLARDLRLDLRGGDCEAPLNHQLTKLAADARAMSGPIHTYYFTLTVRAGAVHQIQELLAINAC
jgi:hypothetical protein